MIGVTLDPDGVDPVTFELAEESFPEICVEDRLFVGLAPAAAVPAFEPPPGDGIHEVAGIGVEGDFTRFFQRLESGDGGEEFHAVVRRLRESAAEFAAVGAVFEDCGPAAGAGVSVAGAIGVNDDFLHLARRFFGTTRQGVHSSGETRPGVTPAYSSSVCQSSAPVNSNILWTRNAAAAASSPA